MGWGAFPASPIIAPSISQLEREMGIFVAPIPMSLSVLSIISKVAEKEGLVQEVRKKIGGMEEREGGEALGSSVAKVRLESFLWLFQCGSEACVSGGDTMAMCSTMP